MNQIPSNLPTNNPSDFSFQVMPKTGVPVSGSGQPNTPPPPTPPHSDRHDDPGLPVEPSPMRNKLAYVIIGLVVLVVLGVLAYFFLGADKKQNSDSSQEPVTKLPKLWMTQYFSKDVCDNPVLCGDDADPDADGLKNYDEFKSGTSPVNPDFDVDGLADGDEVNIYKTEATLKYTDRRETVALNDWTDGYQIKNGYDPLTPGVKFTDLRKKQIEDDTMAFTQHEPTITTLK